MSPVCRIFIAPRRLLVQPILLYMIKVMHEVGLRWWGLGGEGGGSNGGREGDKMGGKGE